MKKFHMLFRLLDRQVNIRTELSRSNVEAHFHVRIQHVEPIHLPNCGSRCYLNPKRLRGRSIARVAASFIGICIIGIMLSSCIGAEMKTSAETSFSRFLAAPSQKSWDAFVADVKSGLYGSKGRLYTCVIEYADARLKRDLPNSMALQNMTPDQFVNMQIGRVDRALGCIKERKSEDLWPLIQKLMIQEFDDALVWSACEIAARLSPCRFEMLAADLEKAHPEELWIIKRVRERWIKGGGDN